MIFIPIEEYMNQGLSKDCYHGSNDWFVTNLDNNKSMWIPDLVPV